MNENDFEPVRFSIKEKRFHKFARYYVLTAATIWLIVFLFAK